MRKLLMFVSASAVSLAANATPSITVDSVVQRWPWNNKVDIKYTVTDGQNVALKAFAKIVFTAVIDGTTYTIDGVHDIGASANTGTHTVTWTAPSGVKSDNCFMSATISSATAPSGDDYLVVDLDTGTVSYEGLLESQEASNVRYNTDEYKKDKLLLRKIPAGGPYQTGHEKFASGYLNPVKLWTTDRDYYMGVFMVTQYQYKKITGNNPSLRTEASEGNPVELRPVEQVTWIDLRGAGAKPKVNIPAGTATSGTFFQRLNAKSGLYFDLPTEVMSEIAERAGSTSYYWWGDTYNASYVIQKGSDPNAESNTFAVGNRPANAWGFYDAAGNDFELCRDDGYGNVLADDPAVDKREDVFTPNQQETNSYWAYYRGGSSPARDGGMEFSASLRGKIQKTGKMWTVGFRVSHIEQ